LRTHLPIAALVWIAGAACAADVRDYKTAGNSWAEAIQAAVAANPGGAVHFPVIEGHYGIDNRRGPLVINGFAGALRFDPGAKLVCQSPSRGCLVLSGGSHALVENLRIAYSPVPVTRINEPAFNARFTYDLRVVGAVIENSPAAGILISASYRPLVTQSTIVSSLADGISFENSEDGTVSDSTTNDTGDDGISFINYDRANQIEFPDLRGGRAVNVKVRNSRARGIAVPGQSNVLVSDFVVENTSASGVLVLQDTSFTTRQPSNVKFQNGLVIDAGRLAPAKATPYGLNYSGTGGLVEFSDITVLNPADRGLSGTAPDGRVTARDVHIVGGTDGVNIGRTRSVELRGITSEDAAGYGIFVNTVGNWVVAENLLAVNASKGSTLRRAVWFENNGDVQAWGINIVDEQANPTGYIAGGFRNTRIVMSGIRAIIRAGTIAFACPENTPGAKYSCEN
jgi:hypothetical protein